MTGTPAPMPLIRSPQANEKSDWLPLWSGYLTFYGHTLDAAVTDKTWDRFHDPAFPLFIVCAYADEQMVGFASYLLHASTWTATGYCYLEDLFVSEATRGGGIGRALIGAVRDAAKAEGCTRLHWMTQEANETARGLYDTLAEKSPFVQYRVDLT